MVRERRIKCGGIPTVDIAVGLGEPADTNQLHDNQPSARSNWSCADTLGNDLEAQLKAPLGD